MERALITVLDWNVRFFNNSEDSISRKLEFLSSYTTQKNVLVFLQETTVDFYHALLEARIVDWAYSAMMIRPQGKYENKSRSHGCIVAGNLPIKPYKVEVLKDLPFPEKSMFVQVAHENRYFWAGSVYIPVGVTYGQTKVCTSDALLGWLDTHRNEAVILGIDANTPKTDHKDPSGCEFWMKGEERLLGRENVHHLRDLLQDYLKEHPQELAKMQQQIPQHPLMVTHKRGPKKTPCRYDHILASKEFYAATIESDYDASERAGSDHALSVAKIIYNPLI